MDGDSAATATVLTALSTCALAALIAVCARREKDMSVSTAPTSTINQVKPAHAPVADATRKHSPQTSGLETDTSAADDDTMETNTETRSRGKKPRKLSEEPSIHVKRIVLNATAKPPHPDDVSIQPDPPHMTTTKRSQSDTAVV